MLEQEDLLYNENYPGKLCALCNLSERSTLGQGDIIKLKISIELDKKSIEKRSKTSSDATESDLSKESPASLNARRKGRKLTSGDSYEPFDELENVGFSEEPDIILLFETSGHFYVHENCATWSEGIKKPAVKDEKESADKTPEKKSGKITEMTGVDLAVKSSVNQKCAYCKHFGASVKCKESGRMYHFPCAAASGSFMYKPTMTLVGTDSLSKVSSFAESAMYLYHDGTWKFGKVGDLKMDKFDNLLYFTTCGQN
jgi:histone-lysine N-methyltransferase MLL3